jgi:predicted small lipoprotein YifL
MRSHLKSTGRLAAVLLLVAAIAAPLAACGKRGSNEAPEDSTYPRTYPAT